MREKENIRATVSDSALQRRRRKEHHRIFWAALVTVAAVHGMLLGLFRHAPRENPPESGELPAVGLIDLSRRGNETLDRWLTVHDPALLTAPSTDYGFSMAAAAETRPRRVLEDLPHPPRLSAPENPLAPAARVRPPAGKTAPLLRTAAAPDGADWAAPEKAPDTVLVAVNGRRWDAPGERVTAWLRSQPEPRGAGASPERSSEFVLEKSRRADLRPRLYLVQSCGAAEFDRAALRILRGCLERVKAPTGVVTVNWPGARRAGNAEEAGT